jgi:predicted ester cyclase
MSTTQTNKEVIRQLYEECMNKRNMSLFKDLVSDDFTGPLGEKGPSGFQGQIEGLIKSFPDIQWKLEDLLGEGDKVAVRWRWQGTQTGPFRDIPATGAKIFNDGMAIFKLKEGKIVDAQVQTDRLGFLQALGAAPVNGAPPAAKQPHKDEVNFIDKFLVPPAAKEEFLERMSINRNFLKKLPGFIEDAAYQYTDDNGNLICVTIARWKNKEAVAKAKEAVQVEYKREGFDMAGMMKRLGIVIDRGIYMELVRD